MLMDDKVMFDCYYCINSAKHCQNEENIGALYFIIHHIFLREYAFKKICMIRGPVQILIILHVLCVGPVTSIIKSRALTARTHENSLINTRLLCPLIHGS